jgi:carbon-monoxide dehydrogenase catalytic subunit
MYNDMEELTGGKFTYEPDPIKAAQVIIDHIEGKRDALGINAKKERKLYDMKERRELQ